MGRPSGYYRKNGDRVPSVTTINGFKRCDALIGWARKETKRAALEYIQKCVDADEEISLDRMALYIDEEGAYKVSKEACDIGTVCHQIIDDVIQGRDTEFDKIDPDILEQSKQPFANWQKWQEQNPVSLIGSEIPLVSEKYRYGGTMDVVTFADNIMIGDWKSSKAIYDDYWAQLAAYRMLYAEHNPNLDVSWDGFIVRFDKKREQFDHSVVNLQDAWLEFLHFRAVYESRKSTVDRDFLSMFTPQCELKHLHQFDT